MNHKLSFMIGGVQKCATASLFNYLRQHPQILMSSRKEIHYFDDESNNWQEPDYQLIDNNYNSSDPTRIRGDATPITIYWQPAHKRILQYNPAMKFIFIFRDPILRAHSHWRMENSREWDEMSFAHAIRKGRKRITKDIACEVTPNQKHTERGEVAGLSRVFSYVERGFYGSQLTTLLHYFPISNMLFLRTEDLAKAPDLTLKKICRFLSIKESSTPVTPIFSNVRGPRSPIDQPSGDDWHYLRSVYRDDLKLFTNLTGLNISDWPTTHSNGYIEHNKRSLTLGEKSN